MGESVELDISEEFEELKTAFSCRVCGEILAEPVLLVTCKHVACKNCLCSSSAGTQRCPTCKNPYNEADITTVEFTRDVVKGIERIEKMFVSAAASNNDGKSRVGDDVQEYRVVVVDTVMKRNPKGETPVHVACKKGLYNKVEDLLQEGVNINLTDYANWSPLHEAVNSGSYECCELLLGKGALPDVPGESYMTPLHNAVVLNNTRIAALLLRFGADKTLINSTGKNALDMSTSPAMTEVLQNTDGDVALIPTIFLSSHLVVFAPHLDSRERARMQKLKARFVEDRNFVTKDDATHLILGRDEGMNVNVLMAVLKGVFVVKEDWVETFIETGEQVAFDRVPRVYKDGVARSVRNRWMQRPKLFDGVNFHVIGHEEPYKIYQVTVTRHDLIALVEAGGGKHLIRPPALRTIKDDHLIPYHADRKSELMLCCDYIIYQESKPPQLLYNMKELRHKTSRWLIDCILKFSVTDS